jgi:hypothetical protein
VLVVKEMSLKSREAASAPLIGAAECKPHQYDVFINSIKNILPHTTKKAR